MKSSPLLLLFLLVVFFSGLFVYANKHLDTFLIQESMDNQTPSSPSGSASSSCPTLLVKEGNVLLLFDPKQPQTDTNPLPFYNLDEYINYLEIQKKKGNHCPILFLQKENDIQGNDVYRIRPSPTDLQGGLSYTPNVTNNISEQIKNPIPIMDADRETMPYNKGNYPGFDPMGLFVGQYTELDKIHDSTNQSGTSANPADLNWGGVQYTQQLIDKGVYDDNNVVPPHLINAGKMMR
jgi:hypothetical protein